MIVSPVWRGRRYAVLGLARSGAATVRALLAAGAHVQAWDADETRRSSVLPELARGGGPSPKAMVEGQVAQPPSSTAPLHHSADAERSPSPSRLGEDVVIAPLDDLAGFDALVVSPGVPLNTHPIAAVARAAGVPIIGDIELFAEARASLPPHKVVGITGTNGKSTTTALVHHILRTAGVPSLMGGNIGLPILAQEPLLEGGVYVLELSSYQIDLTRTLDCEVAVLLDVTPDHLDRYDGFEDYRASKLRLLDMQAWDQVAVVASDENGVGSAVRAMTTGAELTQWFGGDYAIDFADEQSHWPSLQGPHNAQNAWAARIACLALGLPHGAIDAGLRTFTGLPHRMQRVATIDGVAYVNDSKATNPESAAPALGAFPRIHWIVGGRAKGDDLDACAPYFGNVVAAYTIGEAGPRFFEVLKGRVPVVENAGSLDIAVAHAAAAARPGDTVLLSPACASFDQYRDYEERGAAFGSLVEKLA
ncbi:UDP-N-acetylmuramoyl-L-alanine--D-glutamate ligase [Sphingomonas rubra]|uniref:UDP-N-acetylmuramoylalanine--D-glutamate ligase n=1 Tax=Sphingomonas rubra TaxID=634430 RepID=A0A1I5SSE1_9SPHN|nr:UDP-N-acetylmuramoyl-L-alanine--D-glutamate ligase [Sphingomonas rubra]SFP73551.1 UDP-N-acetylmuramoylalanine--D-glutamate ligase [Sphingomonas rubra]